MVDHFIDNLNDLTTLDLPGFLKKKSGKEDDLQSLKSFASHPKSEQTGILSKIEFQLSFRAKLNSCFCF